MSSATRLPPPPDRSQVRGNIDTPAKPEDAVRYLNVRISNETFKSIKRAALDADMNLTEYILHIHEAHIRRQD